MDYAALTSGGMDSTLSIQKVIDGRRDVSHVGMICSMDPVSSLFHSSDPDVDTGIARLSGLGCVEILTEGASGIVYPGSTRYELILGGFP